MAKKRKEEFVSYTEAELREAALKRQAEQAELEAKRKPLSPRQARVSNYWYHYKWHTIGGLVALALLVFFVKDIVFRTDPDVTVELVTSGYVGSDALATLETALAGILPDRNGDGQVAVAIDSIQISEAIVSPGTEEATIDPMLGSPLANNAESDYANVMKFSAIVASNDDPLYLVDDGVYEYILRLGMDENGVTESIFAPMAENPAANGEKLPFSATALMDVPGLEGLGGLSFCIRLNTKTGEKDIAYYDYCMDLLTDISA